VRPVHKKGDSHDIATGIKILSTVLSIQWRVLVSAGSVCVNARGSVGVLRVEKTKRVSVEPIGGDDPSQFVLLHDGKHGLPASVRDTVQLKEVYVVQREIVDFPTLVLVVAPRTLH
jgi:hypothetical protein